MSGSSIQGYLLYTFVLMSYRPICLWSCNYFHKSCEAIPLYDFLYQMLQFLSSCRSPTPSAARCTHFRSRLPSSPELIFYLIVANSTNLTKSSICTGLGWKEKMIQFCSYNYHLYVRCRTRHQQHLCIGLYMR
jgi:hypothetical protein